jgi:hypothetical protein
MTHEPMTIETVLRELGQAVTAVLTLSRRASSIMELQFVTPRLTSLDISGMSVCVRGGGGGERERESLCVCVIIRCIYIYVCMYIYALGTCSLCTDT